MTPQELTQQLFELRGLESPESQQQFLSPRYEDLHDPFLMHDMQKSVQRIFDAIDQNEKICIYSDYDADGIPGAVILHDFFKKIGYENFCNYIPHRHNEGYGVHKDALHSLADDQVKLVITVDVGITAVPEIDFGNSLGLEIIVTDHHEPLEQLPNAFAIVNPKLGTYPDPMLCGAGVAFKLVQAMIQEMVRQAKPAAPHDGWEKWLLDMAGLATLSDMVPLVNENRIIAFFGMKVLEKTQRPGLRALFEKSGISLQHLSEDDITFSITPKLNAAGRMAHPIDAFRTLATTDKRQAMLAAEHLAKLNDDRKKIVARIMREVHKKIHARQLEQRLGNVLVIGDPSWPAGILGLVASKIIEEYAVITFVWGSEEESVKGSVRGTGQASVVELMQETQDLFTQFGGHEDAGGFSTTKDSVHFLEQRLNEAFDKIASQEKENNVVAEYDIEYQLSDVSMDHYRALRTLAPFGVGNKKPIFCFKNVSIVSWKQFGKTTEHLEVVVRDSNSNAQMRAISWYAGPDSFSKKIEQDATIDLVAEFDYSVFRGKEELRLRIVDVI